MGSASHLNQHLNLRQEIKFHIYILHSLKDMERGQKGLGTGTPV